MLSRKGKWKPCLTIKNKSIKLASGNSQPSSNVFDWDDAIIDSLIYASGGLFGSLATGIADGGISLLDVEVALILFGGLFFGFLAFKRKITSQPPEQKV